MNNINRDVETVKKGNRRYRWRLFLIVTGCLILSSEAFGFSGWLLFLQNLMQREGKVGYALFVILYAGTSLAMIPGTGMTLLAGLLFPPFVAIALSSAGALIASVLAFWIARRFARGRVERWLAGNEKYERYSSFVNAHEARVLIFLRLFPVLPQVTFNYVFGLTRISFVSYAFWSWLCLLPGTTLYVLIAGGISSNLSAGHIFLALLLSFVVLAITIYLAW